ncbi:MAG TPA: M15 family metallopeptidase [Symbiobacteriaceae bacterium]|jgi:zinc D-Ala-D-Ala carboxypeptidase|nr:M15 family metallopeptidase [Symbiobacteriaceae bacterium]
MKLMKTVAAVAMAAALAGCSIGGSPAPGSVIEPPAPIQKPADTIPAPAPADKPAGQQPAQGQQPGQTPQPGQTQPGNAGQPTVPDRPVDKTPVVANPNDLLVMVNKSFRLPDGYAPADLVEPNVRFIFSEKHEKRLMRKDAARALEQMFAAAEKDGVHLAGVSGYRSYETQVGLFNYYVKIDGYEKAATYSAEPGHSEHQTGLTMDISGSTGACAADDCFAGTPEAEWLAKHGAEHGFIVRYPKGKESITGYTYEPWHMRYVGVAAAKEITAAGLTLEEWTAKR